MRIPVYKSVYLYLTHACNANCSFCYRRGLFERNNMSTLGPVKMSKQTADDILDFSFSRLKLAPKFTIYFWGGEPTVNFEVIQHVMDKYPQMLFHMNTNGALVNERMYEFFSKHRNIGITWSFGNCYKKYGGPQAKAQAEGWMLKLVRENPNHNVNFMVVEYGKLKEDFDFIAENITRNITIDLATRHDHSQEDLDRFAVQYFELLIEHERDAEIFQTLNPALHSNAYVREFGLKAQVREFHFCKTGLERLFIDTEGGVWQCDNMYICRHNRLGSVYDGIDYSKLDYVWEIDANREQFLGRFCEKCELYKRCPRNKCLGLNLEHMGDMFNPEPGYCAMNKVLAKVIDKYIQLEKEKKGRFMSNEEVVGGKTKDEIKSIDLFVTEQCNMNCDYCFHPKGEAVLSIEQGKKILDRVKELSPGALQVTFFGGEPLLYPQTVIELAQYARELWPPNKEGRHTSTFSISTNGMFFDESVFKKFAELGMAVQVSCDGDEITYTEYRHGDYKRIIENIKKILAIKPDMSVRMTFMPKTVGRLAISVQYLHELGVIKIMHHAVMEEDWTDEAVEQCRYQLAQIYHYRRYCKRQGLPLEIAFIDKPLKIVNDETPPEKEYCQAGKTYIAILDNGDVYPCHRAASARIFKLGNIFQERPFIRGIFLNIDKEYTGCGKNCPHARTCHSCVITHYKVNQELTVPVTKYCRICAVESEQALGFLPVELADRRERMLYKVGQVLVDVAKQNEEILEVLKKGS